MRPPRVSAALSGVPARNALDGLTRLYGVQWWVKVTTVVFGRAPLDRPVDLKRENADLPTALNALSKLTRPELHYEGDAPGRRLSLTQVRCPLLVVLDSVCALFGLSWNERGGRPTLLPLGSAQPGGDPRLSAFLSEFDELVRGDWGDKDERKRDLGRRLMKHIADSASRMTPGERVPFKKLTPEQQDMVREIAQRGLMSALAHAWLGTETTYVSPAAATGAGVEVALSQDRHAITLFFPYMKGGSQPALTQILKR